MIKLSAIIVLYNEFDLVQVCIRSLYKEKFQDMEVILIDNSTDKIGHKKILKKFPKIKYVQNKEDLGFARGVNVGIKHAKGEFIVVVTPDMYILSGTFKKTVTYLTGHKEIGMLGCRIFSSPRLQEPSAVSHYPNLFTQLFYYNMPFYKLLRLFKKDFQPMYFSKKDHKKPKNVLAVSGQYMLMRKLAIKQINYFDPRFFLYFEDIDICRRLRKKGWQVVYLPVGGMVQNGVSDWKQNVRITQALSPYMESLYLFFMKHHGRFYAITAWFVGCSSALISIPYLFLVSKIKNLFHVRSQAADLLPNWIKIVKWHFSRGVQLVFIIHK